MRQLALALCLTAATPVWGETPMTGAEFDAYTLGKTLAYGVDGQVWGIEEYLPNRRVRWAFVGEECKSGYWIETEGSYNICFVYEDTPDQHCWQFFLRGDRLTAVAEGTDPGAPLAELSQDHGLSCPGPGVGV